MLVLVFQNSNSLGDIYGVAVTGTFILNTLLFLAVSRGLWHTPKWRLAILGTLFLTVETAFFTSNMAKIADGAYLSLAVGLAIATIMGIVPTPMALRAMVENTHAFHEKVVIVSMDKVSIPHVDRHDRFAVERVGPGLFKVTHLTVRLGYRDGSNVPQLLAEARKRGLLDRNLDLEHASYFASRARIVPTESSKGLALLQKKMFIGMARNAASPIEAFHLPSSRTVMAGTQISI